MKRNLNVVLVNRNGKPVEDDPKTVRDACAIALGVVFQSELDVDWAEKHKRSKLCKKIDVDGDVDLDTDDMARIKNVTGKLWGPLVIGQISDVLETDPMKEKAET